MAATLLWPGDAVAAAQPTPAPAPVPGSAPAAANTDGMTLSAPSPETSLRLYQQLETWIRAWTIPEEPRATDPVAGVSISLRVSGRVVARSQDLGGDAASLWRAAGAAMQEASSRLGVDPAVDPARARASGEAVAIALELAGPLVPFAAPTYTDVDLGIRPGLEGLAARQGARLAAVFPNAALVSGFQPSESLRAAISEVTGDASLALDASAGGQPGTIAKQHGVSYYRFRTTSLAQARAGERPVFTHRGGRVVATSEMTRESVTTLAEEMIEHLVRRIGRNAADPDRPAEQIAGLMVPTRDDPVATLAGRFDLALTAFVLCRAGARKELPPAAREAGERLVQELTRPTEGDHGAAIDPLEAAMLILAVRESGMGSAEAERLADQCREAVAATYSADAGWDGRVIGSGRGLLAFAMATDARDEGSRARASGAVRSLFRDTPPGMLIAHMPWLGWAELALAAPGSLVPAESAIREMRDQLAAHQIGADDVEPADADLVGGYVFTASSNPLPTWQSLRAVPFLATMLSDPRLTDDRELLPCLTRGLSAMRFVRQLTADGVIGHLYPAPISALGGVRAAVWDQRQPIEATCMGLLSVVGMLDAMDATASRLAAPTPGASGPR